MLLMQFGKLLVPFNLGVPTELECFHKTAPSLIGVICYFLFFDLPQCHLPIEAGEISPGGWCISKSYPFLDGRLGTGQSFYSLYPGAVTESRDPNRVMLADIGWTSYIRGDVTGRSIMSSQQDRNKIFSEIGAITNRIGQIAFIELALYLYVHAFLATPRSGAEGAASRWLNKARSNLSRCPRMSASSYAGGGDFGDDRHKTINIAGRLCDHGRQQWDRARPPDRDRPGHGKPPRGDALLAPLDGMPRAAIATGCVDSILPLEEIATDLVRIAQEPRVIPPSLTDAKVNSLGSLRMFAAIFDLLRSTAGIDFGLYFLGGICATPQGRPG